MPDHDQIEEFTPVPDSDSAPKHSAEEEDPRKGLPPSVQVVDATTPFLLQEAKPADPKGQYIKYIGVGTVRTMGPDEWKAAHVDSQDYFEWNYLNKKLIPRSVFSDEQLQYLLRVDDRFELVELDS